MLHNQSEPNSISTTNPVLAVTIEITQVTLKPTTTTLNAITLKLSTKLGFEVVVGDYDTRTWFELTKGLEHEPERGARCSVCFTHRLTATALFAKQRGISHFTSTLATSRWKNKDQVNAAGFKAQQSVNNEALYWAEDWRKGGLVTRRYELVKEFNFYNQQYCGCVYSQQNTAHIK